MLILAELGIDRSPTRTLTFSSSDFNVRSDCDAPNSAVAASETNFTERSGPMRMEGTPVATRRSTTLVIAGDADSTGNGTTSAIGNGSSAFAASLRNSGPGEATVAADFDFRGLSHFSHRMPPVVSLPHITHLRAMRAFSRTANLTPELRYSHAASCHALCSSRWSMRDGSERKQGEGFTTVACDVRGSLASDRDDTRAIRCSNPHLNALPDL